MPIYGSFIKEQVTLFAQQNPEFKIIVGLRSDIDLKLSWWHPLKIIYYLFYNALLKHNIIRKEGNLIEILNPAISIRNFPKLFNANERNIALHNRNYKHAQKKIGNIQLIHAHVTSPGGIIASYLSKKYKIPFIITEHRLNSLKKLNEQNCFLYKELAETLRSSHEIIAVSKAQAGVLEKISGKKPIVIPNFINENVFNIQKNNQEKYYSDNRKFVFSTLCGLDEYKGIDILLEAIAIWYPSRENVQFRIGGKGRHASFLKELAEKLKINHLIEWAGFVDRESVPSFIGNSNVFVLPSRTESFGIVYIEALACGKPVIATRCGGPEDIVNENNGILIDIDSPVQLAEAMKDVYKNYTKFDPVKIRKDFESRFSSNIITKRIGSVYKRLIMEGYRNI